MTISEALTGLEPGGSRGAMTEEEIQALSQALARVKRIEDLDEAGKSLMGLAISRLRAANGGRARAERMTSKQRSQAARKAAKARWADVPAERDGVTHGSKKR